MKKKAKKKIAGVRVSLAFRQQMCISWVVNVPNQYMIPIYFYKEIERSFLCLDTLFYGLHEFCWRQNHFSHSFFFHLVFFYVPTSFPSFPSVEIADRIFQTKCLTFAYIWRQWRRFFLWTPKTKLKKNECERGGYWPTFTALLVPYSELYIIWKGGGGLLKCVYIKHPPMAARFSMIEKKN